MNDAKFKSAQQIVFLGILTDSVTMTIRFDSVSAKGFRAEHLARKQASRHQHCPTYLWKAQLVRRNRPEWTHPHSVLLELFQTS